MTDTIAQTQALLGQIPALAAELPQFLHVGTPKDSESGRSGHSASKPPVNVELLDLIAGRDIEWWVLLAIDEMTEADIEPQNTPSARIPSIADNCTWLAANTEWITNHNDDYPAAIKRLHWSYRRAARQLPGPRISCPDCGARAFIGDGLWMICTEVEDHARTIRSIEHEHRYQPAETTKQIVARYGIGEDRLHQWRKRRKLSPAKREGRSLLWWPWDVFCLLNPTVAEAINARDEHRTKEPA